MSDRTAPEANAPRRVATWVTVSMDGFTSGPGGPRHDTWLYEHALREQTAACFETV